MLTTMTQFLNDLRDTDIGQAVLATRAKQERAARKTHIQQLEQLEHERATTNRANDALVTKLRRDVDDAKKVEIIATRALRDADIARHDFDRAQMVRIDALKWQLRQTADPRIDEAHRQMVERLEVARSQNSLLVTQLLVGRFAPVGSGQQRRGATNMGAIVRLMEAAAAAGEQFEQLKLQSPSDVEAAIAKVLAPVESAWARVGELDDAATE